MRVLVVLLLLTGIALAEPVVHQKGIITGVWVHWVTVDLASENIVVRPMLAPAGHQKPFESLVGSGAIASINGTFFDTRSSVVVGNLVSEGRMLAEGSIGTTLSIDNDGRGSLRNSAGKLGRYMDWSETAFGVAGGPTLISGGEYFITPAAEGFKDPSLFSPRPRSAVGLTANNKLLLVSTSKEVSLWQMARIMKRLKAHHAVNLDGGSSTGLYWRGQTLVSPRRKLTNVISVFPADRAPTQIRGEIVARRARGHYQKGLRLLDKGNFLQARSHLRQAVAKAPNQARYWSAYAKAEEAMGDSAKAATAYNKAADIYLDNYKPKLALSVAQRALKLRPAEAETLLTFARAAYQHGRYPAAAGALRKVVAMHPGHPAATELLIKTKRSLRAHHG